MSDDPPEEEAARPSSAEAVVDASLRDADTSPEAPRPKKRKKKRKKARDDEREDVPAFARNFPRDPALDALVEAYEAGNYARVRREGPELARSTDSDEVRAAARELVRRLDPDPLAVYLLAGAAVLLVFLAGWFWSHPHVGP